MTKAPVTYFFMHIMKTAGTTFAQHVHGNFAPHEIYPAASSEVRETQYWKIDQFANLEPEVRSRLRVFHGHFPFFASHIFGADVTLTILREPIERTISHLRHCQRHIPGLRDQSLEQIYDGDGQVPGLFVNYQIRQFASTPSDLLRPLDPPAIDASRFDRALSNLSQVGLVGLTDEYEAFTAMVHETLGWHIGPAARLEVSHRDFEIPDPFRRRLERENKADIDFYDHARARVLGDGDRR